MCGICGIFAFTDGFAADEATVTRMRDTLTYRGPDDAGAVVPDGDRVALGHRRLSIVDLSAAGHQPMSNEDGTVWITYNGEVYNHEALRAELEAKGHRFRSRTDTEAILHLYEEEGPDSVLRLEGMFAFAIWDGRRRELFLARDRVGVKPLYYAQPARRAGVRVRGQGDARASRGLARPRRAGVLRLPDVRVHAAAGHDVPRHLEARAGRATDRARRTARSSVPATGRHSPARSRERSARCPRMRQVQRLRDLLRESIRKRMMSDVPFGVFLSGGVDSSTNVALMAELIDRPVRTFATAPSGSLTLRRA